MLKEEYNKKFDKKAAKEAAPEVQNGVSDEVKEVTQEVEPAPVVKEEPKVQKVKVTIADLNIRKGPGKNFDRTGEFTGVGVFEVSEIKDGFAKLADGRGWVSMEFAKLV